MFSYVSTMKAGMCFVSVMQPCSRQACSGRADKPPRPPMPAIGRSRMSTRLILCYIASTLARASAACIMQNLLSRPSRSIGIVAALAVIPGVVILRHAWDVYRAVSPVSRASIVETDSIPDTLESSDTLSKHVNPAGHVALRDTRYIDVNASLGHEQVLVSFMHGFFGGRVFSIERALLRFFCPELVDYKGTLCRPQRSFRRAAVTGIPKDLVCPGIERSPEGELPPIWGFPRFRRLSRGRLQLHRIISGSNRASSGLAGVHRVSISGSRLEYAYLSCNPSVNKALKPDFLQVLHKVYAMLLFKEGVAKVLEGESGM